MTTQSFEHLSRPLAIGKLTLKHRLIMGPMGDRMWSEEGTPAPGLLDYYLTRAKGGAALITIGASEVHAAYENGHRAALSKDGTIGTLRQVTDALHAAGTPVFVQMHHGGPSARPGVSPSGVPCLTVFKSGLVESRALSLDEVIDMREHFIAAAARAQQAGFDGVEIAGQANYLLGQFFSPRMNLRRDAYGGSVENRMRLALEIVRGVRDRCGADFIVGYALSADELKPGGVGPEDGVPFAVALQQAGLSYLDVRVGTHESFAISARATAHNRFQSRHGIWNYSAQFKRALAIPVFCSVQGCYDPAQWEQALANGHADVIQLGKPLLVDPELPRKVLTGKSQDVRPCIYCMQCLDPSMSSESAGARTYCAVNAEAGAEWRMPLTRAATSKQVLVVGGGPAGMEAARVAALRGHQVTLWEKDKALGGKLRSIGACEGGDVYLALRDWLSRACEQAGVEIKLGVTASAKAIRNARPNVVMIAQGATTPAAPDIKGIDKPHVVGHREALSSAARIGEHVVVLGGGQEGVLIASTLAAQGRAKTVIIVEPSLTSQLGQGLSFMEKTYAAMTHLPERGVEALVGARITEIRDREVLLIDSNDKKRKLKADTVILALSDQPDPALQRNLQAEFEVHVIGDAKQSRNVAQAIHEGAHLARLV